MEDCLHLPINGGTANNARESYANSLIGDLKRGDWFVVPVMNLGGTRLLGELDPESARKSTT
jgi:hypothetical protein